MNYKKIYQNIVERAKNRKKELGLEKHHILPQSCGGTNDKNNLVFLTTREHFICHLLLIKIYKDNTIFKKKMIYALWWMAKTRHNLNGYKVTSRMYELARKEFILNSPNKCEERKKRFIENHKAGKYNYDYAKVSSTMKKILSSLTRSEVQERMKKSALSCDQEKRKVAIKKGKGSQLKLTDPTGNFIIFWSYDNIKDLTGYRYDQLRYRLKRYNGDLGNGYKIEYISRYTANDKNVGRKRNNRISTRSNSE
jgi:hypothetical protein